VSESENMEGGSPPDDTMPLRNVIAATVFLSLGLVYGYLTSELPDRQIRELPGPGLFPTMVTALIVVLSIGLLIKGLIGLKALGRLPRLEPIQVKAVVMLAWVWLFVTVIPDVGFLFAAIPFFAGLMWLCDSRKTWMLAAGSVFIPLVCYHLFREVFRIMLPGAPWM